MRSLAGARGSVSLAGVPPIRVLLLLLLVVMPGSCDRLPEVAVEVVVPPELQADYDAGARGLVLAHFVPDSPNSLGPVTVGVLCDPQDEPVRFVANHYAPDYPDVVDVVVWIAPLAPDESPTACGDLVGDSFSLVHEFDRALPHARGEIAVDIGCDLAEEGRAEVTVSRASP